MAQGPMWLETTETAVEQLESLLAQVRQHVQGMAHAVDLTVINVPAGTVLRDRIARLGRAHKVRHGLMKQALQMWPMPTRNAAIAEFVTQVQALVHA